MFHLSQSSGVVASQVEDLSSPVICKVSEDGVEDRTDKKDYPTSSVYLKRHLDPSKSCTELEQDQDHVDESQD